MTGLMREEVIYRFKKAESEMRSQTDADIVNPCRVWAYRWPWIYRSMERVLGKERAYTLVLLYDLWLLSKCQRVHLIGPDWMVSRGSCTEMEYAKAAGMEVTMDVYKYDKRGRKKS